MYEDPAEWLLKEGQLPHNVTPENSKLKDPEETRAPHPYFRTRIDRACRLRAASPTLAGKSQRPALAIGKWKLRREKIFLTPGDSPAGFRLPLSALPWTPPALYPYINIQDPTEPRGPLPDFKLEDAEQKPANGRVQNVAEAGQKITEQSLDISGGIVRTALSVEVRDGRLCVFMPPVEKADDYLELVAAAEQAAKANGLQIHIEGYAPPPIRASTSSASRPIPGVIEVNVHPATSWKDCVDITTTIYEEARQTRLGADKFMIDGRHTGTGGGNHVVVGGATPNDSRSCAGPTC